MQNDECKMDNAKCRVATVVSVRDFAFLISHYSFCIPVGGDASGDVGTECKMMNAKWTMQNAGWPRWSPSVILHFSFLTIHFAFLLAVTLQGTWGLNAK